jgi:hypothetical protein
MGSGRVRRSRGSPRNAALPSRGRLPLGTRCVTRLRSGGRAHRGRGCEPRRPHRVHWRVCLPRARPGCGAGRHPQPIAGRSLAPRRRLLPRASQRQLSISPSCHAVEVPVGVPEDRSGRFRPMPSRPAALAYARAGPAGPDGRPDDRVVPGISADPKRLRRGGRAVARLLRSQTPWPRSAAARSPRGPAP